MSLYIIFMPILAALVAPEGRFLDCPTRWLSKNDEQSYFLKHYFNRSYLQEMKSEELTACASNDCAELNEFAKKNGISHSFSPFNRGEFGVVSIFSLNLKWLQPGQAEPLTFNARTRVEGVVFESGLSIHDIKNYPYPLVCVYTQNGDKVYFIQANCKPTTMIELSKQINTLRQAKKSTSQGYSSAHVPMIHTESLVDINWLANMYCFKDGEKQLVSHAFQQMSLSMNEFGFDCKSGVALGFAGISAVQKKRFIFNKPFYVFVERPGIDKPIVQAYIDEDSLLKI